MSMRTRYAGWLAVLGAAAFAVGCGVVQAGQPAAPAPAADVAAHQTPQRQAAADAASLLAAFGPPPGAVRSGPLAVSSLAQEPDMPMAPDELTRTRWYLAPGAWQAVFARIVAHPPAGLTLISSSGVLVVHAAGGGLRTGLVAQGPCRFIKSPAPGPGPAPSCAGMWAVEFGRPAVPGVLALRMLEIAVAGDGPGRAAIRVDATVGWVPARPAAETIPASARVVTISPDGGTVPSAAGHQVTITDPALVARIAAAVNALPVYPPRDPMWCDIALPRGGGPAWRLAFRASAGGRELAVVTAYQELCQLVNVVTGGKTMPSLDGAQTLIQQVMAIAGVRWTAFPAPGPTMTPSA
jgi:hypothetical protein